MLYRFQARTRREWGLQGHFLFPVASLSLWAGAIVSEVSLWQLPMAGTPVPYPVPQTDGSPTTQ